MNGAPSRFWRYVLERCVPEELRESVSADLDEVFAQRVGERGERDAARWYRREALSFAGRFAGDGLRRVSRRVRGTPRGSLWLDFKLGMRMLVRYPGLTVIGGLAMAFGIWVGAGAFEIVGQITRPSVPLPGGDRIVGIRLGVVPDLGMFWGTHDPKAAGMYHAVRPDALDAPWLAVAVRGEPASFSARLRRAVAAVEPSLRMAPPIPLDDVNQGELMFMQFWFRLTLVVSAVALALSLAGIYAVMWFTVTRRTREIGIRVALGADPRRLIVGVLRRPMTQVASGLGVGALLAGALLVLVGTDLTATGVVLLLVYAALLLGVCAAACALPVRRALGIEPTQALAAGV
jgi:hypothetical protein